MSTRIGLLLLVFASLNGAQSQPYHANARQSSTSEIPTVSLCTLLSKPAEYNGKEIRVSAQYHIGFEYSYFDDPSCKDYAVETTPYWTGNTVWAEFGESVEAATKPEVYKKFREKANLCCPSGWRDSQAEVVVTGRFFKAEVEGEGYGHSGRYALQIIVNRVEKVCDAKTGAATSVKENPQ